MGVFDWAQHTGAPTPAPADLAERDGATTSYGQAALDAEVAKVRAAHEGIRNPTLNEAAFAVFQLVEAGHVNGAQAYQELKAAALAVGLTTREVPRTMESARAGAERNPRRDVPDPAARDAAGGPRVLDEGDPWDEPEPLDPPRTPATFPVDALPDWASHWVTALAEATQTPPDLAGCCLLGVLSACAGGRAVVQARPGWREPAHLYALPVLPSGSRKSAVVAAATRPLYAAERELIQRVQAERDETLITKDIAQKAADKAMRAAGNAGTETERQRLTSDAVSAQSQADAIEVPVLPRLIADDATPEAVASLLADHGGRLAMISAEGGIFDLMAGRYSKGIPVLDVWLKGHSGDPVRVDRKGRASEYIDHPALTLLLTVQPAVLAAISRNGTFRGRGLLARFLYSVPANNVGHREIGAEPVPDDVAEAYDAAVRKLAADLAGWTDPMVLHLDGPAHELLLDTERRIEPSLAEDGSLGPIAEWGSKLAGAIVRIAGLLHLAEGAAFRTPISRETLAGAVQVGAYFTEHARAAFQLLGATGTSDASYVLDHLARHGITEFTIRSLHVGLPRGRFATADDVTAAVDVLADHGYVRAKSEPERRGRGRPPSPSYRVHPKVGNQ